MFIHRSYSYEFIINRFGIATDSTIFSITMIYSISYVWKFSGCNKCNIIMLNNQEPELCKTESMRMAQTTPTCGTHIAFPIMLRCSPVPTLSHAAWNDGLSSCNQTPCIARSSRTKYRRIALKEKICELRVKVGMLCIQLAWVVFCRMSTLTSAAEGSIPDFPTNCSQKLRILTLSATSITISHGKGLLLLHGGRPLNPANSLQKLVTLAISASCEEGTATQIPPNN